MLLSGKTVLLLGAGGAIASQTCYQWALEGAHVIGLGLNVDRLRLAKREIDDIRGKFDYFLIDINNQNSVRETINAIFDRFSGANFIVNFVDEYGLTLLSDIPLQPYQDAAKFSSNAASEFYQSWMTAYQERVDKNQHPLNLERTVDIISFNETLELASSTMAIAPEYFSKQVKGDSQDPQAIQRSRVYVEGDKPNSSSSTLTWAATPSTKLAPALIVDDLFNLLTHPDYSSFDDIVICTSGDYICSLLYSLSSDQQTHSVKPQKQNILGNALSIYVKETKRGRGVFASRDFVRGDLILKTTGKVLNHQTEHTLQIDWNQHFEPDAPIRLINHSCEPNAGVKTNQYGIPDFFAFKDIKKDEEITFDYAMTEFTHQTREDPSMEFDLGCKCGAKTCRGKLGYYSELPAHLKEAYQGFISDYLLNSES